MENDIIINNNNYNFNYRVAIIIKRDNELLVQKDIRNNYYALPGGRCKLGETTINTAIRELKEETGIDCEFVKSIGAVENFFVSSYTKKRVHELLIIHELKFINTTMYEQEIIKNIEENEEKKQNLSYRWIEISKLKNDDFRPSIILDILGKNEFQYKIYRD